MNQKTHTLRIKGKYYNYLVSGLKNVEVRVGYSMIRKINVGDFIVFENHEAVTFEVTDIKVFKRFDELFDTIDVKQVLPDCSCKEDAVSEFWNLYTTDKEDLGVYALYLKVYHVPIKLYRASRLIASGNHNFFCSLISECYKVTDFISPDYPRHFEWYYTQHLPGLFTGEREIFAALYEHKVVGVIFAKKTDTEKKVCTIWVKEDMRGKHLASKLLEASFAYLGTTKPLISIAEYKMDMFKGIVAKYDWKVTQRLEGYYSDVVEIVFNGELK